MYLSKSIYCKGVQCKKMLWLEEHYPEEKEEIDNSSVLDNGTEVGILAKDLFGKSIDIEFSNNLKDMIEDTLKVIKNNKNVIITEASFSYNNNFCSVDILIKNDNEYTIVEFLVNQTRILKYDVTFEEEIPKKIKYFDCHEKNVLIIDDNYEKINYLINLLKPYNLKIEIAHNYTDYEKYFIILN